MAARSDGEIQYPSSALVKYLNILAAAIGIISVVLDVVVPVAQQVGKKKQAREGLERAMTMTILFSLVRALPRVIREVRRLRAQMATRVAA